MNIPLIQCLGGWKWKRVLWTFLTLIALEDCKSKKILWEANALLMFDKIINKQNK